MTDAEIEAFLAVTEAGTITGAAENLFLSQSTMSGRIRVLEDELGVRLLQRGKGVRSVELTEAGRRFEPLAEHWKKLWRETRALSANRQERELRTSAVQSINLYILPRVYRRFAAENPDVRMWLRIRHSVDSYALVESGSVEAALVVRRKYSRKVDTMPLWREPMTFVCKADGDYGEVVCPEGLDPDREVLLDWSEEFLSWHDYWMGANRPPKLYTDDMALMEQFLRDGDFWAVMPRSVAGGMREDGWLRECRLRDGPQDRVVYLLTRSMTEHTEELKALLHILREVVTAQGAIWLDTATEMPKTE